MSPSNLGIVFGPSLMRPRPTGATVSLSSLVDYPHQARIVEALIVFYTTIFQSKSSPSGTAGSTASTPTSTPQVGLCVCDEGNKHFFRTILNFKFYIIQREGLWRLHVSR